MLPSFPPIYDSLATGIDGTAFDKVSHGFTQIVTIAEVVVEHPFFRIDPVPSPDPYDFHGNHLPS